MLKKLGALAVLGFAIANLTGCWNLPIDPYPQPPSGDSTGTGGGVIDTTGMGGGGGIDTTGMGGGVIDTTGMGGGSGPIDTLGGGTATGDTLGGHWHGHRRH